MKHYITHVRIRIPTKHHWDEGGVTIPGYSLTVDVPVYVWVYTCCKVIDPWGDDFRPVWVPLHVTTEATFIPPSNCPRCGQPANLPIPSPDMG